MRVLYIEDNPMNMRLVRKMLVSTGFDLLEAYDGRSGLELANMERPDLILMDVNLPGMSGLDVTRTLKNNPDLQEIPIIALTSNDHMPHRIEAINAGCDGYLAKPVSRAELVRTLRLFVTPAY